MGNIPSKTNEAITAEKLKQEQEKTKQLAANREKAEALAKQEQEKVKQLAANREKAEALAKQEQEKVKQVAAETVEKQKRLKIETTKAEALATQVVNQATNTSKQIAAQTEQIAVNTRYARRLGWFRFCFGVGLIGLLGIDYLWNGNEWIIRRRVKNKLWSTSTANLPPTPTVTIPTSQEKLEPMFQPTLLLGPSGAGKSTLLSSLARECINAQVPVKYISIRGNTNNQVPNVGTVDSVARMNLMASQVLRDIGYPTRDPFIISFVTGIRAIGVGTATIQSEAKPENLTVARFNKAFACLFGVCNEIRNERKLHGFSDLQAAPVILMDEVHDLIKDSKLANVGGREMFDTLTTQLVTEGVTKKCVRSVIAGSNGLLALDAEATHMGGCRLNEYYLQDPSEADVKVALKAKGYTEEECNEAISLCGTRLRVLEDVLLPEHKIEMNYFIRRTRDNAVRSYTRFFYSFKEEKDKQTVGKILDRIYEGKTDVRLRQLPEPVQQAEYSKVLYIPTDCRLQFQSQAMRNVWKQYRVQNFHEKELK